MKTQKVVYVADVYCHDYHIKNKFQIPEELYVHKESLNELDWVRVLFIALERSEFRRDIYWQDLDKIRHELKTVGMCFDDHFVNINRLDGLQLSDLWEDVEGAS